MTWFPELDRFEDAEGAIILHRFTADPHGKNRPGAVWKAWTTDGRRFVEICEIKHIRPLMRRGRNILIESAQDVAACGLLKPSGICPEFRERLDFDETRLLLVGRLPREHFAALKKLVDLEIRDPVAVVAPEIARRRRIESLLAAEAARTGRTGTLCPAGESPTAGQT